MRSPPLQMPGVEDVRGRQGQALPGPMSASLGPEEPPASLRTSSWLEALWLQPGTALAQAFKGFLTGRPLCQHSSNFLQGLQLHQDYRNQKEFSTWAGKGRCPVSLGNKVRLQGGAGLWLGLAEALGVIASNSGVWPGEGNGKGRCHAHSGGDTIGKKGTWEQMQCEGGGCEL